MAIVKGGPPKGNFDTNLFLGGTNIECKCPKCNKFHAVKLDIYSLYRPPMNVDFKHTVGCEGCEHEFDITLHFNVSLHVVL